MKQRPDVIFGATRRVKTGCGYLYVTINYNNQKPFEVFVKLGKAGGCSASYTEAIGRVISVALRSGVELQDLADKLKGIGCNSPTKEAVSCGDAIGQTLGKNDRNDFQFSKVNCPKCYNIVCVCESATVNVCSRDENEILP